MESKHKCSESKAGHQHYVFQTSARDGMLYDAPVEQTLPKLAPAKHMKNHYQKGRT